MTEFLTESRYFGLVLSLVLFLVATLLQKKWNSILLNPLIFSTAGTIGILLLTGVPYESYKQGADLLQYFITPATVCLAIPLYEKIQLLKDNWPAILSGILVGVLMGLGSIFLLSMVWGLEQAEFVSLMPKSITTAIAMGLSEKLGGYPAVTATAVMITGIFGYIIAVGALKIFRITDPIAKGVAIGTSCHVIGTTRAMEIGETEGAMSSLSLAVAGVVTAFIAPLFTNLYQNFG